MYKCNKCNKAIPDNQVEENVVKAGLSDNPKLYCKECGEPVVYIPDSSEEDRVKFQGAQATLNSTSDNRVVNGNNSGNTTNINIHNNDAANIDKLSEAFGRVQEQTADTIIRYMKEAASLGNKEEKLLTEDWGEIDKNNACTCNSCHNPVPSQHYDHQQHLCVNCLYKKAEKLKDKDLWDEAIDEFKRVEMISTAELLPEVQEAIGICYYMDGDKKKAKKYLALAETPWSYYVLGYCFLGEDDDQALRNFTKAAEKDVVPAQVWLKDYYLDGKNKQIDKAEPWLLKLAKGGNLLSQYQLANVYLIYASKTNNKNNAQEYYKKAAGWLEKVAEQDIDIAKYQLGDLLLNGNGLDQNIERAIELMTQAGEKGFVACQFDLATIYEKGKYGIAADSGKAFYWYKKVAEQNPKQSVVVTAMNQIGHFYLEGKGVGRNYQEAANWFKKAATRDNVSAQVSLGKLYKDKLTNWDEAINWLSKASSSGNIEAKYELGCLYLLQSATKPERKSDADSLLATAANGGHVGAMMRLAQCYEDAGAFNLAQNYYQKAADKGDQQAKQILDERFSGKTFAEKWRKFIGSPIWGDIFGLLSKMKGCLPFIIGLVVILFVVNMCTKACQSCTGVRDSSSAVSNQTIYSEADVDEPAHYPTGIKQLNKDIKSLVRNQYMSGGEQFLSGEIHLHFILTKEGRAVVDTKSIPVENKDLVRGLVEVMNHLPKQWQPAKKDSEYVNQYVDIELDF